MILIVALSALFVYYDARKHGINSPGFRATMVWLFWIIAFPAYLLRRREYIRNAQQSPSEGGYPWVAYTTLGLLTVLSIGVLSAALDPSTRDYNLAVQYLEGRGVEKDDVKAASLFRKAADRGMTAAQYNLGILYHQGRGVLQDDAEAAALWRKAANQGFMQAQNNLGLLYVTGKGVERDYAQAAQWYRKAADQGLPQAQYCLGVLYANGAGVPKDSSQALMWLRKAADRGFEPAKRSLSSSSLVALNTGRP